jgi:transposase-like protein
MERIKIMLPEVNTIPQQAERCPYCSSTILRRHGKNERILKDEGGFKVRVDRCLCLSCHRSFRIYPSGVSSLHQSKRLLALVALLYSLGLSLRSTSIVFYLLKGISLGKTTIWQDIQREGKIIQQRGLAGARMERVAGVDQTYFKIKGKKVCLNIAVSPQGNILSLELLSEESSQSYASIFNQLKQAYGVEVIVTDDHKLYPEALEAMEEPLPRQLCLFHLKRNVAKWLKKLDLSEEEKERVKGFLSPPTLEAGGKIYSWYEEEAKRNGSKSKLAQFLLYLSNRFRDITTNLRFPFTPKTNNHTERAIIGSKLRYRTTRGLKSEEGALNFFSLNSHIYNGMSQGLVSLA